MGSNSASLFRIINNTLRLHFVLAPGGQSQQNMLKTINKPSKLFFKRLQAGQTYPIWLQSFNLIQHLEDVIKNAEHVARVWVGV